MDRVSVAVEPLERAARRDRARVARVLGNAFRDMPLTAAVVPGPERERLRSTVLGLRTAMAGRRPGSIWLGARVDGRWRAGLAAVAPGFFPLTPPPLLAQLACVAGQGLAVARRWAQVYRRLLDLHPEDRHWYLATLGVDPPVQGTGIGSALLADLLRRADEDGLPVYLETDREANLVFYGRAGFEVAQETRVFGVPVWCLWRPVSPRPPGRREEE